MMYHMTYIYRINAKKLYSRMTSHNNGDLANKDCIFCALILIFSQPWAA